MATKKCMKCGGTTPKMAKGGATTNKLNKPKAPAKPQTGGSNTKMGIYGIPNAGRTDALGFKKGGAVKKMQDGGKVIKTKDTVKRYSSQRTPEFVKGDRTTYANEPSDAAQYGKIREKRDILGRKVIKTPYTETQASGRKSTGIVTDKFNRQDQLKKTVNKSSVTSANGAKYKAKDVTKVEGQMKKGGAVKKMAKGGFPDLNRDGKVTKADILKGRGVIKKIGGTVRKRK